MIEQVGHRITNSLMQWFDNKIITEGQAFTNYTGIFYPMTDTRNASYATFALPFGQMIGDSSVSGASIISGIYVNSTFVPRGTSGLVIDFQHGRVFLDPSLAGSQVSGEFAIKEFDLGYSTSALDELIMSNKFAIKPQFLLPITGLTANQHLVPCILWSKVSTRNQPFEFGKAADLMVVKYRGLVVTTSDYQLDGVDSIIANTSNTSFPLFTGTPFNESGDLRGGYFNFNETCAAQDQSDPIFVKDVKFTKFSARANNLINPMLTMGAIDITLELRNP